MLPIQNPAQLREALLQSRLTPSAAPQASDGAPVDVFSNLLHAAQQQIHATDVHAQQAVSGLLRGEGVEVHEAMIATQQADLTFELALQVRNKAVAAYQQMMQMQF